MLSFVSALLQAATAVLVIVMMLVALRGTAVSMADATRFLEISSYALISTFGAWLVWRKAAPLFRQDAAGSQHGGSGHAHCSHADHQHSHAAGAACGCGHAHMPDPGLLAGDRFNWRTAWTAITAVGLRPCSGALIVLTFAFLNGLWLSGLLSVLAMAIGTAVTVSLLATLAVTAKNAAVAVAGEGRVGRSLHVGIEIAGAGLVLVLGLVLLGASLSA
jgi:ABC-type nickel/cobalt efflux system permease component RcnA